MKINRLIKKAGRLLKYREERSRFFAQVRVRRQQNQQIKECHPRANTLLLFLIPGLEKPTGKEKISGGIISIVSIYEESVSLMRSEHCEVVMATFPDEILLSKHQNFPNQAPVLRFEQLEKYFNKLENLIIHLPEFMIPYFQQLHKRGEFSKLFQGKNKHINILNQNILLMPEPEEIRFLRDIANLVTITTAHKRYCTQEYCQKYQVPIHRLSVWISPEQYQFKPFEEKDNLLVVSPDPHPMKEEVLHKLQQIQGLKIIIIQNLTYSEYKALIAKAKWSLTFGEGLDGYYIEPVFSGAVSLAVFNNQFFTEEFEKLPGIFADYGQLLEGIVDFISTFDTVLSFKEAQQKQFAICERLYSGLEYRKNIELFYKHKFTFGPK